jgi:hypothetical protein
MVQRYFCRSLQLRGDSQFYCPHRLDLNEVDTIVKSAEIFKFVLHGMVAPLVADDNGYDGG